MVWATSSGVPARPAGMSERKPALASASLPVKRSIMGVSMRPGATALMRTPKAKASRAAAPVSPPTLRPCWRHGRRRRRQALLAGDRRDVDDGAGALGAHDPQLVLDAQQHAQHVGVEAIPHRFTASSRLGGAGAFHAGIVDRHVQPAEAGDGVCLAAGAHGSRHARIDSRNNSRQTGIVNASAA